MTIRFPMTMLALVGLLAVCRGSGLSVPKSVDLGQVEHDQIKDDSFVIKNQGEEAVTLKDFKTSCGCVRLKLVGDPILPPGAERVVTVRATFGDYTGDYHIDGDIQWQSPPGGLAHQFFTIRGNVVAPLILEKKVIDLGKMDYAPNSAAVQIEATRGNSPQKWDSVRLDVPAGLKAGIERVSESKWLLTVGASAVDLPLGDLKETLRFHFLEQGTETGAPLDVKVVGKIVGPIKSAPSMVFFGTLPSGQTTKKAVEITSDTIDLTNLTVTSSCPWIVPVVTDSSPKHALIDVTATKPEAGLAHVETLMVSPAQSRIQLRVNVLAY